MCSVYNLQCTVYSVHTMYKVQYTNYNRAAPMQANSNAISLISDPAHGNIKGWRGITL